MDSYTIVRSNRLNAFGRCIGGDIQVEEMFEMFSPLQKIEVELCLKAHMKIPERLFNKNLIGLNTNTIVVFDGHARPEFLRWLAENNPGRRLIFWCWNAVAEIEKNLTLRAIPDVYEIWSYSEYDCRKYGLKHNTTFYWNAFSPMEEQEKACDLYFIGKDKGRYKRIKRLEKELSAHGIRCLFQIIPTHWFRLKKGLSKRIPYQEVLEHISKTKGILDIAAAAAAGPSLRPIEAAFYGKKLLTDNKEVKKMKFYNAKNICVIGGGY